MALTNFGKIAVTGMGMGLVFVFVSAAAPAFAGNNADVSLGIPPQSEQILAASDVPAAPPIGLLFPPHRQNSGSTLHAVLVS